MSDTQIVKQLDLRTFPHSGTIIAIGPPESGKTFLLQFLAYAFKHIYAVGTAVCGTEDSQGAFTPIFGPLYTTNEYSEEDQIRFAERQQLCIREGVYPFAYTVIDDCSDDPKIYSQKIMLSSFKNGRQHWKRLFAIGLQFGLDMKPSIRKLVSYVFIFREPNINERRKIWMNFGGICGSFESFCALMDQFTEDFHCLVINMGSKSNKFEDNVFWFKCPSFKWSSDSKAHAYPEGWKFGCNEYKEWQSQRVDPKYK